MNNSIYPHKISKISSSSLSSVDILGGDENRPAKMTLWFLMILKIKDLSAVKNSQSGVQRATISGSKIKFF